MAPGLGARTPASASAPTWRAALLAPPLVLWSGAFLVPLLLFVGDVAAEPSVAEVLRANSAILWRSLVFAATATALSLVFGAAFLLLAGSARRGLHGLLSATAIALILLNPLIVSASVFFLLQRSGPVGTIAGLLGFEGGILFGTGAVLTGALFVFVPVAFVGLDVARREVDPDIALAAGGLGARPWRVFLSVEIPAMRAQILALAFLIFAGAFGMPILPDILGAPRNELISGRVQTLALTLGDWRASGTLALLLVVATLPGAVLLARSLGERGGEAGAGRGRADASGDRLRPGRVLAQGLVLVVLASPLACLVLASLGDGRLLVFPPSGLSGRWFVEALASSEWRAAALRSALVALAVAVLSVCASFCAALYLEGRSMRRTLAVDTLLLLPGLVPPIVLALGMGRLALPIGLDPWLALTLAHSQLVLPVTYLLVRAAMIDLDRDLLRAAMDLGARPGAMVLAVILPLLRTRLAVAAAFAMAVSVNEPLVPTFLLSGEATVVAKLLLEGMRSGVDPRAYAMASLIVIALWAVALALLRPRPRAHAPGP